MYLVRTPTPVYNTTHHVLKRIAVANETMLTEVKKEVDVMVRKMIAFTSARIKTRAETLERASQYCSFH